jgi:nitroimidazol reductase NimA-like FMN-containing flavoprotein (pyridoxamine 5'-phosphate oxidase superfamily)
MSGATTPTAARDLIDRSGYMTLATADADGQPWASPVWFAHGAYADFLWVSRPDARHSLNIEVRPAVALVIFDSTVAPADAQGVYVEAEAEKVPAHEIDAAIDMFSAKSLESGLSAWSAAEVTGLARHRLYRARTVACFVLAANDRRVPISLSERIGDSKGATP